MTAGWVRPERGASAPARLALWVALRLGWQAGRVLLLPVTGYFLLTGRQARRASRDYLVRVLGRRPGWRDLARHFHAFAAVTLDRVWLLAGRVEGFDVRVRGLEALRRAEAGGRGCILLGAHLGSFEVLRSVARDSPTRLRPLMYRRNAGAPTRLLEALDADLAADVIDIGAPDAMLRVGEALARGEMVGMLADRAPRGERCLPVPFLGGTAAFPAGPLLVAAVLDAPVILFHGVRTGPRSYEVGFEAFADRVVLRRDRREADLRAWLERYAAWLEALCRAAPFNWFNFYPFWDLPHDPAAPRPDAAVARRGGPGEPDPGG